MLPHRHLTGRILAAAVSLAISVAIVGAQQQPPQPGAKPPQAPPRSPYQEAGQLPARIMSFTAEPQTVKPGDVISATGGAARSGAPSMISAVIELPDGRKIRS